MAAHHKAMLDHAGRLFRQRGVSSVSVAEVTAAAGLTHGGFYGHFASKGALAAETCEHLFNASAERWRKRAAAAKSTGDDPVATLIDSYLTVDKRDHRGRSCVLATLGAEASRDPGLLPAMTAGVLGLVTVLTELIAERRPDTGPEVHEGVALAVLAVMVGGLTLARALAGAPRRSAAALKAATTLAKQAAISGY